VRDTENIRTRVNELPVCSRVRVHEVGHSGAIERLKSLVEVQIAGAADEEDGVEFDE